MMAHDEGQVMKRVELNKESHKLSEIEKKYMNAINQQVSKCYLYFIFHPYV